MKSIKITFIYILLIFLFVVSITGSSIINAQLSLNDRYIKTSSSEVGAVNVNYTIGFTSNTPGSVIGSVGLQFCQNSPLSNDVCTPVNGLDVSSATLINQTGITNFNILNSSANTLNLVRVPSFVGANTLIQLEFTGVDNPNTNGTFYGRIQVYPTPDFTGFASYEGGMTFAIDNPVNLSTWVPPWLFICVGVTVPGYTCNGNTSSYINLGELSPRSSSFATSEVIIATNATSGYSLFVTGNTLTSGINTIRALNVPTASIAGTSQFGINLKDNSSPNVGSNIVGIGSGAVSPNYNLNDRFMFNSGDFLASSSDTALGEKYTISYLVNVDAEQKPGIYSTTLVYVVSATF